MKPASFAIAALGALLVSPSAFADSRAWTTGKSVIPATATVVGGISASSVRSSGLYQQFLPLLMSKAGDAKTMIDAIQKTCSIDILASIDSAAVGVDDNSAGSIVVALKGTNHKALEDCMQKMAKANSKTLAITTEGKFTKYAGEAMGAKSIYVEWLAPDTFALSTSPDDKDLSTKLLASGIEKSTDLKVGIAGVNKSASVWLVGKKETPLPDVGGSMKAFYVSAVIANKKIDANAHLVTDSDKTATALSADAQKKLAAAANGNSSLKTTLSSVKFTKAGSEVVGTASIPEDEVLGLIMTVLK